MRKESSKMLMLLIFWILGSSFQYETNNFKEDFSNPEEVIKNISQIKIYAISKCAIRDRYPTIDEVIKQPELSICVNYDGGNFYHLSKYKFKVSEFKIDSSRIYAYIIFHIYSNDKKMEVCFNDFGQMRLNRRYGANEDSAFTSRLFDYVPKDLKLYPCKW